MGTGELIFIGFCTLAAINALFFACYLLSGRDKKLYPSIFLSLFLIITAIRITQVLLHDVQEDFEIGINLRSLFFFIPTFPLLGPLLLQYIKSVTVKSYKLKSAQLLHLLPFFLVLILDLTYRDKYMLPAPGRSFYIIYVIEVSLILAHFLIYIIISYFCFRKITGTESQEDSTNNYYDAQIKNIIILVSIVWAIYLIYCLQIYMRVYLPARVLEAFYYSVLSYLILFTELRSKRISSLYSHTGRYRSSPLSSEDAERYRSMITESMKKYKLYQDHKISLVKLSRGLSLKPHTVSQVINEQLSCNFNDFINSYRVEDAKKMLLDPGNKNLTIASIAYDSGFNTLSAFNTAFRKFTGMTPSQFRSKV